MSEKLMRAMEAKINELQSALAECEELEASLCPEDVGFAEYIAKLKSDLEQSEDECKLNANAVVAQGKIIDELVKALVEYSCHMGWCKSNFHEDDDECDCGLTQALKKARPK